MSYASKPKNSDAKTDGCDIAIAPRIIPYCIVFIYAMINSSHSVKLHGRLIAQAISNIYENI